MGYSYNLGIKRDTIMEMKWYVCMYIFNIYELRRQALIGIGFIVFIIYHTYIFFKISVALLCIAFCITFER